MTYRSRSIPVQNGDHKQGPRPRLTLRTPIPRSGGFSGYEDRTLSPSKEERPHQIDDKADHQKVRDENQKDCQPRMRRIGRVRTEPHAPQRCVRCRLVRDVSASTIRYRDIVRLRIHQDACGHMARFGYYNGIDAQRPAYRREQDHGILAIARAQTERLIGRLPIIGDSVRFRIGHVRDVRHHPTSRQVGGAAFGVIPSLGVSLKRVGHLTNGRIVRHHIALQHGREHLGQLRPAVVGRGFYGHLHRTRVLY